MEQSPETDNSLISLNDIHKSFSTNRVLKGVSLTLNKGDVMALIGGNGAGKSTLMKIIMGIYMMDSGEIFINGERTILSSPLVSLQKGIYLVPQEPMLFPNMTVEENILIGFNTNKSDLKKKLIELMKTLNWNINLDRSAETLSIAEQQLVEILKGLLREAKILILDEPTSALTFNEIKSLFKLIGDLRKQGIGIFYITHRLTEVFEVATHVIILRDGRVAMSGSVKEFTKEMLIKGMLPPDTSINPESQRATCNVLVDYENTKPLLEIRDLTGYGFKEINLSVYPGEILGLAGMVGSGRTELAEAIFGIGEIISGHIILNGHDITGLSTEEIIKHGLNYVPEDRHLNGIFSSTSVTNNITSSALKWLSKFFLSPDKEISISQKYIEDFKIKVTSQEQTLGLLSGGNQQKVVIGKTLSTTPKTIILDEPTRGIDAGSRADVYKIIYGLKEKGNAILVISSDMEEILELCDKVQIMHRGIIRYTFDCHNITLDKLMEAAFSA